MADETGLQNWVLGGIFFFFSFRGEWGMEERSPEAQEVHEKQNSSAFPVVALSVSVLVHMLWLLISL
jgi:hypothetical protein